MQSQYLYLNANQPNTALTRRQNNKKRTAVMALGSIAIVGFVGAAMGVFETSKPEGLVFFGDSVTSEKQQAFMSFLATYGRTYATKNDMNNRFQTFSENFDRIQEHNANNEHFKMEINQFADLSVQEFEETYLQGIAMPDQRPISHHTLKQSEHVLNESLPEAVDWNQAGKVLPPQDQSSCGSCWAWTTAGTLESLFAIKHDLAKPDRFSVQYLVDCDKGNFGCQGGWMLDAYDFTSKNGIVKEEDYNKYGARAGKCQSTDKKQKFYNTFQMEEDNISNQRMKELVSKQPVGVAMYSSGSCMAAYSKGVMMASECKCSDPAKQEVNHAVTIVGYGKSERKGCDEYWLVKNSWGSRWGENGFFRLCADADQPNTPVGMCQVNSYVQYPLLD